MTNGDISHQPNWKATNESLVQVLKEIYILPKKDFRKFNKNMIDTKTNIALMKISNNIIELLDIRQEMPNGDFQGCIEAQVISAYLLGKKENKND